MGADGGRVHCCPSKSTHGPLRMWMWLCLGRALGRASEVILGFVPEHTAAINAPGYSGTCSYRTAVGTDPPMVSRIRSRSLFKPVYFTTPSMFTSARW